MTAIGSAEVGELLRRNLGMKGRVELELLEQILPVVIVSDLRLDRQNAQTLERAFGLGFNSPAVVGQLSKFVLTNVGSGSSGQQDVLIDELIVQAAGTMGYQFGFAPRGTVTVGIAVVAGFYDGQFQFGPGPNAGYDIFRQSNAAAQVQSIVGAAVSETAYKPMYHRFTQPLVVPPGVEFIVEGLSFNTELRGNLQCRERARVP